MKLARLLGRLLGGQPHMTSKTLVDFLQHLFRDFPHHLLLVTVTIGTLFSSASVLVEQPPLSQALDVLYEGSLASSLLVVKLGPPGEIYPTDGRTIHTCTTFCAQLLKRGHQGDQLPKPHSLLATLHYAQFGCTIGFALFAPRRLWAD